MKTNRKNFFLSPLFSLTPFPSFSLLLHVASVSDMIPCFTDNGFYNTFRGSAFIDGGYCSDFAQLCPGGLASTPGAAGTKCLKMATTFLGPDLRGTPLPTVNNCPASTPRNKWVNVGKVRSYLGPLFLDRVPLKVI